MATLIKPERAPHIEEAQRAPHVFTTYLFRFETARGLRGVIRVDSTKYETARSMATIKAELRSNGSAFLLWLLTGQK